MLAMTGGFIGSGRSHCRHWKLRGRSRWAELLPVEDTGLS
jgi:hypothetical protein